MLLLWQQGLIALLLFLPAQWSLTSLPACSPACSVNHTRKQAHGGGTVRATLRATAGAQQPSFVLVWHELGLRPADSEIQDLVTPSHREKDSFFDSRAFFILKFLELFFVVCGKKLQNANDKKPPSVFKFVHLSR